MRRRNDQNCRVPTSVRSTILDKRLKSSNDDVNPFVTHLFTDVMYLQNNCGTNLIYVKRKVFMICGHWQKFWLLFQILVIDASSLNVTAGTCHFFAVLNKTCLFGQTNVTNGTFYSQEANITAYFLTSKLSTNNFYFPQCLS